jgi:ACT domain-containing protein
MKQQIKTLISQDKDKLDEAVNRICLSKKVFAIQTDMLFSTTTGLIHKAVVFYEV